jgi:dynein intermediate chain 2
LDVWDISHNQNEVAYSHKVSDASLTSISIEGNTQGGGKLVAVGNANGIVSLLEVCDSLAQPATHEKASVNSIFERETKREKNLEVREREARRAKQQQQERMEDSRPSGEDMLQGLEADFFNAIKTEN